LKDGTQRPINARFNVLVNSARTSCSEPNLQNLPSGRKVGGTRECFVPRDGFVYVSVDYDTLELRALAQVCLTLFGRSEMAESINKDRDLHSQVGATMLGMTYEDVEKGKKTKGSPAKTARDAAKVFNFGAPGGLGASSLVDYARAGYGVTINEQQAREMKAQWLRAWPEMVTYFEWVNQAVGLGEAVLRHPITGFVRGDVGYTDGCNHLFQHLAAQGAKRALYRSAREAYAEPDSPFFGSRPVVFVHDEIIAEVPEDRAASASRRLAQIMCEEMALLIPDVKITASPTLMRYWTKDAVETYDADGTLVPWEKIR
jgi:DNA polymerase-1